MLDEDYADYYVSSKEDDPDPFYVGYMYEELPAEFWHHYEIIRGKKVEEDKKDDFLACCC